MFKYQSIYEGSMITLDQYLITLGRAHCLLLRWYKESFFFKGMYEENRVIIYQNYFCQRQFYSLAYLRGL